MINMNTDYIIYKNGSIWSNVSSRFLKGTNKDGYRMVNLKGDLHYVHRLVATKFILNPLNKKEVNHIDGDKLNNYVSNLEWNTHAENMKHGYKTNLINNSGERAGASKLTEQEVLEIRNKYKIGNISQPALAKQYNTTRGNISKIILRTTWREI